MKVAVAAGGLDVLVTWEASRAQRDLDAYLELRRLCAASGVRWAYSGTVYDLAHGSDRFRTGLDALVAEDEVEKCGPVFSGLSVRMLTRVARTG